MSTLLLKSWKKYKEIFIWHHHREQGERNIHKFESGGQDVATKLGKVIFITTPHFLD